MGRTVPQRKHVFLVFQKRVHRDDFWRKNSEVTHLSKDMDVERKECHSDESREAVCPQKREGHARAVLGGTVSSRIGAVCGCLPAGILTEPFFRASTAAFGTAATAFLIFP